MPRGARPHAFAENAGRTARAARAGGEVQFARALSPAVNRARFGALVIFVCLACFAFDRGSGLASIKPAAGGALEAGSSAQGAQAQNQGGTDFSKFSHTSQRHASLACASCHERAADNSAQPRLPGHKSCTGCHLPQFVTVNVPMCAICHTSVEGRNPPVKEFPPLRSFNARFDHAQHNEGGARPERGCASCHAPMRRGLALTIPAGASAHENCYQCHTPGARGPGGDISSCGACHRLGRYARTPETAAAYRVNFGHAAHTSKGLACAECHTVRAGQPQRRQVTSPSPLMHHASAGARSCMTCHDNRRAFGGDDFKDCTRCHKGDAWHF